MTATTVETFLRSYDAREMPRYTASQVAAYLKEAESTIRAWFFGTTYGTKPNIRHFSPVLRPAGTQSLSFYDAASAHVLLALKAQHLSLADIRAVVYELQRHDPDARYPLLGRNFYMFGKNLIIKEAGKRLTLTKGRQLGFRHIMDKFLRRIELDENKMPTRFSPILSATGRSRPYIVIDPNLSGGRPVVRGTGIAAEVIALRRQSGESISKLSRDYRLSKRAIEEAVKYSQKRAA